MDDLPTNILKKIQNQLSIKNSKSLVRAFVRAPKAPAGKRGAGTTRALVNSTRKASVRKIENVWRAQSERDKDAIKHAQSVMKRRNMDPLTMNEESFITSLQNPLQRKQLREVYRDFLNSIKFSFDFPRIVVDAMYVTYIARNEHSIKPRRVIQHNRRTKRKNNPYFIHMKCR
jgi:hypothetical protein